MDNTCKIDTETVNLENSSRPIGGKRLSLNELVSAYSRKPKTIQINEFDVFKFLQFNMISIPECKLIEENVPMHPLNLRSRPICHVTNNGLQINQTINIFRLSATKKNF